AAREPAARPPREPRVARDTGLVVEWALDRAAGRRRGLPRTYGRERASRGAPRLESGAGAMSRRRVLLWLATVFCLAASTMAALLASDVRAWQQSARAADARSDASLPAPSEILPFHVARSLLGLGDDLALRRALRLV